MKGKKARLLLEIAVSEIAIILMNGWKAGCILLLFWLVILYSD